MTESDSAATRETPASNVVTIVSFVSLTIVLCSVAFLGVLASITILNLPSLSVVHEYGAISGMVRMLFGMLMSSLLLLFACQVKRRGYCEDASFSFLLGSFFGAVLFVAVYSFGPLRLILGVNPIIAVINGNGAKIFGMLFNDPELFGLRIVGMAIVLMFRYLQLLLLAMLPFGLVFFPFRQECNILIGNRHAATSSDRTTNRGARLFLNGLCAVCALLSGLAWVAVFNHGQKFWTR